MSLSLTASPLDLPVSAKGLPHAVSIDVEDYYHVEAFRDSLSPDKWLLCQPRILENMQRVLALLDRLNVKATFFVLGWVAEHYPSIVREILACGHEVGCHSYGHQCVWRLSREEFRSDTRRARAAIEDAGGVAVLGYRAPSFSIVKASVWAVEILASEGFSYDSSVFPIYHDIYGYPGAPRFPFRWTNGHGHLLYEVPPTTVGLGPWNLPAAGGAYLRILPEWYTRWAVGKIQAEGRSLVVYFHPWEVDPQQPRLKGRMKSRLRHYTHLKRMEGKLERLLQVGRFTSIAEYLQLLQQGRAGVDTISQSLV